MNYYQLIAFAQQLKKENMKINNDAFINDAYNEESKLHIEFMDEVKAHDYSYMMSDDDRVYSRGRNNEKQIQEKLHALIAICRYDGSDLLDRVLSFVKQEYNDKDSNGDDLTHRVIKGWFKPYITDGEVSGTYEDLEKLGRGRSKY
jgi:hypothetical protein